MDGEVRMCRGRKRGRHHGNKDGNNNKSRDDPQNAEHTSESGLGRAIPVAVEKDSCH